MSECIRDFVDWRNWPCKYTPDEMTKALSVSLL